MPRKIRQLKSDLRRAGLEWRPGKGSHGVWVHPRYPEVNVTLSGQDGDDAQPYQERELRDALAKLKNLLESE